MSQTFCCPCGEYKTWTCCFVRVLQEQLARLASIVCKYQGHDMVDAGSFANPDTGQAHMKCTRCGYYWSHIYY